DAVNTILEHVLDFSEKNYIYASNKQKIMLNDNDMSYVIFLLSGEVLVHRLSDDIVVLNAKAPVVMGLTSLLSNKYYHYLQTTTDTKIISIKRENMLKLLDEKKLWMHAFKIVSMAAQYYYQRDEVVFADSVYGVIKNHLEILWQYPKEDRLKISIFDFILSRSKVSRSSLNKVLK
ncbi:TPA: helix-turn-helix domain-containing protein, partial [Enterobacter asburiae]|nr:helix-turn-helix domain-containing protein [Enterobacter asburiae]